MGKNFHLSIVPLVKVNQLTIAIGFSAFVCQALSEIRQRLFIIGFNQVAKNRRVVGPITKRHAPLYAFLECRPYRFAGDL
jgi:hypothetical protein